MQNQKNKFEMIQMPPQNTNSVVVFNDDKCVIFDPWGCAADWENYLNQHGVMPVAIYATHGHSDHISAAPEIAARYGIDWHMSHSDIDLIKWGNGLLEYFKLPPISPNAKQPVDLQPGEYTILGNTKMHIIEMPGHSRGGVAYYFPDDGILIIGDTLFQDSYGRTDLPGGNESTLFNSIRKIYDMNLPDTTVVLHGHGMHTTIGWLRQNNPFFKN